MGSHVAAPVLTPNVKYDSARDFEPIGLTAHAPAVIVARKDFPAKNLTEFIAYSETERREREAGAWRHRLVVAHGVPAVRLGDRRKPQLVAYRGTGPAMNDLIGGHVDFFCEQAVSVTGQIKSGAIKAYAVSSAQRARRRCRTCRPRRKLGVDYPMSIWAGIFAPKGTPNEVVDKLADALDKALDDPGVQKRLADLGGAIPAKDERGPATFDAFVKAEIARWSPILKAAGGEQLNSCSGVPAFRLRF